MANTFNVPDYNNPKLPSKADIARAYEAQPYDFVQGNGKVLKSTLGTESVNPILNGLWADDYAQNWYSMYGGTGAGGGGFDVAKGSTGGAKGVAPVYGGLNPTPTEPDPLADLRWEAYLAKMQDANKATYDARIQAIADAYRTSQQNADRVRNAQEAYAMEQYAKSNPTYGVNAESIGNAGLARSGYSEYLQGNAYNNKVNGILQAQAAYGEAMNNAESQKLNDTVNAQIARNEADLEAYQLAYSGKRNEVANAEEKAEAQAKEEKAEAKAEATEVKNTAEDEAEKQRVYNANKYAMLAEIDDTDGLISENKLNAYIYSNGVTNEEDILAMQAYAKEHNRNVGINELTDAITEFKNAITDAKYDYVKLDSIVANANSLGLTSGELDSMMSVALDQMLANGYADKKFTATEISDIIKAIDEFCTKGAISKGLAKARIYNAATYVNKKKLDSVAKNILAKYQ